MRDFILGELEKVQNGYSLCGIVDRMERIYPLGSDTKLISTLFEIVVRQAVASYANSVGMQLVEPTKQNHYPDFTLMRSEGDQKKIALDVKTTYRKGVHSKFHYALGSFTSYIHPDKESKNIVFPYSQYDQHWILGFVYTRTKGRRDTGGQVYSFDTLRQIPVSFDNVEVFMQEKWRIAGDKAGSGNTTNIGSISGTIDTFSGGKGIFNSEAEFLEYWRGYKRTRKERQSSYSNIHEFRTWKKESRF